MKHQEGFFNGVRDHRIYYQYWLPETEPKAVLLVVHGLAEHGGRYMNLVNHFLPLGYAVYAADHLGHGSSEGTRVYVERFTDYTDTLVTFHEMIRGWQKDKPVFLVGHSMGGLIGALYLLDHQDELAGAVLSGPGVKVPDDISPVTIFAGKVLSILMPRLGLIQLEAEGVSRDPAVVKAYETDPLVYRGKITARLGVEMIKAMKQVSAEESRISLPLLILQGGADRLVHPSGAQMLHDGVASVDRKIILYDGLYHEVFNEPEHGRVLRDVEMWLAAHSG
ncbi:MAG: lysophospholipase [Proteobacteria bacterium]|nr:lysophospholipase [Pseudomonadota bacterium]MBU4371087.1 lysophospholipase [Pseudomonadota bacterium]MBU4583025.1 lysophospholipase [Pseudomonadota bacterium]MCG2739034.1 lysophospholipase [Syntrophaceae bacterium]